MRRGQVLWNLGEVFLSLCEYQKVLESIYGARTLFERIQNYEELADVLFILGKLYFKIGFYNKLEETFVEFNSNYSKLSASNNFEILRDFIGQWVLFGKSRLVSTEKLRIISEEFIKRDDGKNFLESSFLLIKLLIQQSRYNEAIEEMNRSKLVELCSQNSILEAEREYFLGIISKNFTSDSLLPPLVYFEKAYELIKDENISELTWKVLFEISELYIERGNLNKAKHFVTYTRELIYLIAERIESPRLRAAYLRQDERLNTLKEIGKFLPSKMNMSEGHFNIKVFSDSTDLVSVTSALKQLELKGFQLNITFPSEFEIDSNEIIVLKIESLDSALYKNLIKIKKGKTNKFVIVINNSDALLVTSLLKQGFFDIYVFPYEVLKFTSFLAEIISNKSYITESGRSGTFGMNRHGIKSILGDSEKLLRAVELASKVSEKSNSNVLILGETGTGKGLFARAIHNNGPANQFPFIDISLYCYP